MPLPIRSVLSWNNKFQIKHSSRAVAIEEIEAWVLTICTDRQGDTCRFNDPKDELNRVLNRKLSKKEKRILRYDELEKFKELSKKFRRPKNFEKYANFNESLKLFCESLEEDA